VDTLITLNSIINMYAWLQNTCTVRNLKSAINRFLRQILPGHFPTLVNFPNFPNSCQIHTGNFPDITRFSRQVVT